jgi:type III secretory pathway component EscU
MLIVQDERVIKYFRLQEVYESVAQIHNLKKIFDSKSMIEISKTIDTAIRVNMRDVVISKVRDMRKLGELVNIDIIKLLEEKLCFDLSDDDSK